MLRRFEIAVVVAIQMLLVLTVAITIVVLYVLFFNGLRTNLATLESVGSVQAAVQNVFGGVLLVLLGLELIETLKVYFAQHYIRIEVILIVAMIAVGRHIIQIDFEHVGGLELVGTATIMVALAVSYFLVRKIHHESGSPGP